MLTLRLTEESKDVYKVMDEILLQHDNTSTSPESVRPTRTIHRKGYPAPGPCDTVALLFQGQKQAGKNLHAGRDEGVHSGDFQSRRRALAALRSEAKARQSPPLGPESRTNPLWLSRVRPGAAAGRMPAAAARLFRLGLALLCRILRHASRVPVRASAPGYVEYLPRRRARASRQRWLVESNHSSVAKTNQPCRRRGMAGPPPAPV